MFNVRHEVLTVAQLDEPLIKQKKGDGHLLVNENTLNDVELYYKDYVPVQTVGNIVFNYWDKYVSFLRRGESVESQILAFKIHKGTVSVEDYIAWSHSLLEKNVSSPSVNIIASFPPNASLFEVEDYFQKALKELQFELPAIEPSSRAYIAFLATEIMKEENEVQLAEFAHEIFRIVVDLQYPEDLLAWYNISEMLDRLTYDTVPLDFTKDDVKAKMKEEARRILASR